MYSVKSVVDNGKINETLLLQAHQLERSVFEVEIPEARHDRVDKERRALDINDWRDKLRIPHANVLCIIRPSNATEITPADSMSFVPSHGLAADTQAADGAVFEQVFAISFNYPRNRDGLESYHIYVSAVHPSARGTSLFSRLLNATKEDARSAGCKILTISTYPDRFPTMFAILNREGSGWELVKWENEEGGSRKVVMKMILE